MLPQYILMFVGLMVFMWGALNSIEVELMGSSIFYHPKNVPSKALVILALILGLGLMIGGGIWLYVAQPS